MALGRMQAFIQVGFGCKYSQSIPVYHHDSASVRRWCCRGQRMLFALCTLPSWLHTCKRFARACVYSLSQSVGLPQRASASAPAKPCMQPGRASGQQVCLHMAEGTASYLASPTIPHRSCRATGEDAKSDELSCVPAVLGRVPPAFCL